MISLPIVVFVIVYLGMGLGRVPGLAIDRTGIALLGLIALLAAGSMTLDQAGAAIDTPTICLLFALMIVSAQFEQSGFYAWTAEHVTRAAASPKLLLGMVIAATGLLSAILTNDVVVFALTPLLCSSLRSLDLDPRPYLIGLAGAANAGSALTLIGNPQNILIGQVGHLDFWQYTVMALPPTLISLGIVFGVVAMTWPLRAAKPSRAAGKAELDKYQFSKALMAIIALIILFFMPLPREVSALAVAGVLLLSRRLSSREMIGAVDWHLLLLFVCLFGVTEAFARTGVAQDGLTWLEQAGLLPQRLSVMVPVTVAFSNTIGNVPAVILIIRLLPDLGQGPLAGLALLSTLSGNLLLTGSMCNIIIAERAASVGAQLSFMDFARSGVLMTIFSLAAATVWLWGMGLMQF